MTATAGLTLCSVLAIAIAVAADPSACSLTISAGFWKCTTGSIASLYESRWLAAPGAVNFTMLSGSAWSYAVAQFSPDNTTITAVFSNGHHGIGNVSADCSEIAWNDLSKWAAAPAPQPFYYCHLAMHTHDDVGWDETFSQYLLGNGPISGRNVTKIITNVVAGLLRNASRRFTYVEQAFFTTWYEAQTPAMQSAVQGLVASRQLVFLNSGWSMSDESSPTYIDMLDNAAVGQRSILEKFGLAALPTITSQLDPFGHSAFQGVLSSSLAGFQGVVWGREDATFKAQCRAERKLERVWMPSASLGAAAATFAASFVDSGYGTPGEVKRCDGRPSTDAEHCNASFAAADLRAFMADIYISHGTSVRGQHILINLGTDFTAENAIIEGNDDPTAGYFGYVDALRDGLNADPRFRAFYSSAADYVAAKLTDPTVKSLPLLEGDLFPYADDTGQGNISGHNMWSGYFTSRPAFKGFVRETSSVLQSARQMQALAGGVTDLGPGNPLFTLERAMGVAQHHDAISGTAKQVVSDDYSLLLEAGRADAFASLAASFATLTGYRGAPFAPCPLANASLCPALESGAPAVALIYNALAQAAAAAPVRLAVGLPAGVASYAVYDATGAPLVAQLVPLSARDAALRALYNGSAATPCSWLYVQTPVPAAGFAAIFLVPSATAVPTTHASVLGRAATAAGDVNVSNGRLTLTVAAATGLLAAYADAATGVALPLAQSWRSYVGFNGETALNGSKQASGAYIFRPASSSAAPVAAGAASVTLVTGPVVNLTQHALGYVTQETRLWAGAASAELEWTVGPVDVADGESHEVIARYEAPSLASGGAWRSDANCRELQPRTRGGRANYSIELAESVAGNYAPVNCLITLAGSGVSLAVAVDRSEGGASLADGALELMVHRRMLFDDSRGVHEALNEPGVDGKGLIIRGRHWLAAVPDAAPGPAAALKALQRRALALPHAVAMFAGLAGAAPPAWIAAHTAAASALAAPLPAALHLATLHVYNASALLLRLAHDGEAGDDPALAAPVTLGLARLLARRTITAATEMTLPGTQPLAGVRAANLTTDGGAHFAVPAVPPPPAGSALTITLTVQQIRTFMCQYVADA